MKNSLEKLMNHENRFWDKGEMLMSIILVGGISTANLIICLVVGFFP